MAKSNRTADRRQPEPDNRPLAGWLWPAAAALVALGLILILIGRSWYGPVRPPVDPAAVQRRSEQVRQARQMLQQAIESLLAGKTEEALRLSEQVLDLAPDLAVAHLVAARAALELRLYNRAEQGFRKLLEIDPRNPDAQASLGALALLRGQTNQARQLLDDARRQMEKQGRPLSPGLLVSLAAAYADQAEKASALLKQAVTEDKDGALQSAGWLGPAVLAQLARVLDQEGMAADAAEAFAAAAGAPSGKAEWAARAAELYLKIGNLTSAAEQIGRALQLQPNDPSYLVLQRRIRAARGEPETPATQPGLLTPKLELAP